MAELGWTAVPLRAAATKTGSQLRAGAAARIEIAGGIRLVVVRDFASIGQSGRRITADALDTKFGVVLNRRVLALFNKVNNHTRCSYSAPQSTLSAVQRLPDAAAVPGPANNGERRTMRNVAKAKRFVAS